MTEKRTSKTEQRIATIHDEKQQIPDLVTSELIPPSTGIFDEPVRYYKANKEWTKFIEGWLTWLAEIAPWYQANEHDYPAIEAILEFLVGIDPPAGEFPNITEPDCFTFPLNEVFIGYSPMNPFTQPGLVPSGWISSPFFVYDGSPSLPPQYQFGDIVVPIDGFPLSAWDVFSGDLPQITATVQGSGQIEADFIKFPTGGIVIETINNPPDIGDIIAGIFTDQANFFELRADIISFPPEESWVSKRELNIDAEVDEITTVYWTFFPWIDESLNAFGFGGGIRSIQLCGFEGSEFLAITDVRMNNCILEYFQNGEWTPVNGFDPACFEGPQGEQGPQGIQGEQGPQGPPGESGSGGGGIICLDETIIETDGQTYSYEITESYEWIWVECIALEDDNPSIRNMFIVLNDDTTNANYDSNAGGANSNQIAYIGGSNAESKTVTKIQLHAPSRDDIHKVVTAEGARQYAAGGNVFAQSGSAVIWKDTSAITKVSITAPSGFIAGSVFRVFGVLCGESEPTEPTEPDWIVEFDFLTNDYDELLIVIDESTHEIGNGYVSGAGASENVDLLVDLQESVNIVLIETEFFVASSDSTSCSLVMVTPTPQTLVDNQPYPDDTDTMSVELDETNQTWRLALEYTGGFSIAEMQWRKLRFGGTGTIPSALTPYQI